MNDDDKKLEQSFAEEDHGGIAPELEEAGDMSTSDGLGGPESGPLGDDHESRRKTKNKLQFRYTNWRGEEHLYLVEPQAISFVKAASDDGPAWYLHALCLQRDGESRRGHADQFPRRSFKLKDLESVNEVVL